MRYRLLAVTGAVLFSLCSAQTGSADLWGDMVGGTATQQAIDAYSRAGEAGVTYRGPSLRLPASSGGTAASINLNARRGCGVMDFASEFQALFNANAIEDYLKGVASSAISSAPLVLMCYASPTLCDAYKHFRQMASGLLQLKSAECQAIEQAAMGAGEQMRKRQEMSCVEEKVGGGMPMYQALDECKRPDVKLVGYDMQQTESMDVVGDALDKVGASQELKDLGKAILGDIHLRVGGGKSLTLPSSDAVNGVWSGIYDQYLSNLSRAMETVAAGRPLSAQETAAISAPGRPITSADLRQLMLLDPAARAVATQKLAAALTMAKLNHQINDLRASLVSGARLADQTTQSSADLQRMIETLEAARARLRDLKADTDAINDVLAATAADAAAKRRDAMQAVAPAAAPKNQRGVGPDGGSFRLGGGLVLPAR